MEPRRKRIRLAEFDYASPNGYFVTVCSRDRAPIFGDVTDHRVRLTWIGTLVSEAWLAMPCYWPNVALDAFVVMPNHIHGVLLLTDEGRKNPAPTLGDVIGGFKAGVSRQAGTPIWQRGFWDRVIRSERECNRIRRYIDNNPARWLDDPDRL